MPSLARKLLICAAVDGLIIQPLAPKGQRPSQPVKIKYGDAAVSSISRDQSPDVSRPNSSFEAFGIVGLFTVSRLSYLITITGRQQVAQIRGCPVYVVTDVALTPCTSQTEAESVIRHTSVQLRRMAEAKNAKNNTIVEVSESETDEDVEPSVLPNDEPDDVQSDRDSISGKEVAGQDGSSNTSERSSIAEDVIKRRGSYGRFAQRWFSHKGWVQDQKRNMGISGTAPTDQNSAVDNGAKMDDSKADKELSKTVVAETSSKSRATAASAGESLLPKLLRTAHIWFGSSRSFFFSYEMDITRKLSNPAVSPPDTPIYKTVDPLFWWNRNLLQPFIAANEDSLLLPLMQGFVGQRSFVVDHDPPQVDEDQGKDSLEMRDLTPPAGGGPGSWPDSPSPEAESRSAELRPSEREYLITVISRRIVKRAGLRYLRRGIDEEGHAANGVETEQILSSPTWNSRLFSFVQIRGSIPIFFTQSPTSLKPVAVLQHSDAANLKAFKKHIGHIRQRYGSVELVNLVEKHGVEAIAGEAYEKIVDKYNKQAAGDEQPLGYEWFDFHTECRGMKFENVSLLLDTLGTKIQDWGSTVINANGEVIQAQKGVLRTNCIDCLDRTNVCQSSFAKHMLDQQLKEEGFDMSIQIDQQTNWFNTLWADNGDAISKQYASTAAMKGDFTRTRKRDLQGMMNDLGLSLTRFYNGLVNDYFSQAAIDFFLGNVTSMVFEEFEANMMTKDPAVSMTKMREQAIEISQSIVIEKDKEDFQGGWTMLSPHISDSIKALPFEEVVLLLTDTALYLCRFDWKLDKVSSFERADLAHVIGIKIGTYITSTISPTQADEKRNTGLLITYESGKADIKRINTRSLSSLPGQIEPKSSASSSKNIFEAVFRSPKQQRAPPPKQLAFKALYAHSSISDARSKGAAKMTEMEQIELIAHEIERLVFINQPLQEPDQQNAERKSIIDYGDIISLAEAKKNTGLLEQWAHGIKKLVWA